MTVLRRSTAMFVEALEIPQGPAERPCTSRQEFGQSIVVATSVTSDVKLLAVVRYGPWSWEVIHPVLVYFVCCSAASNLTLKRRGARAAANDESYKTCGQTLAFRITEISVCM